MIEIDLYQNTINNRSVIHFSSLGYDWCWKSTKINWDKSILTLICVPTIVILVFRSYCPKVYDMKKTEGTATDGAAGSKPHKPFVHSYTGPSVTKTGKPFHMLVRLPLPFNRSWFPIIKSDPGDYMKALQRLRSSMNFSHRCHRLSANTPLDL